MSVRYAIDDTIILSWLKYYGIHFRLRRYFILRRIARCFIKKPLDSSYSAGPPGDSRREAALRSCAKQQPLHLDILQLMCCAVIVKNASHQPPDINFCHTASMPIWVKCTANTGGFRHKSILIDWYYFVPHILTGILLDIEESTKMTWQLTENLIIYGFNMHN